MKYSVTVVLYYLKSVRRKATMDYKDYGKKPYMLNIEDATNQNDNSVQRYGLATNCN